MLFGAGRARSSRRRPPSGMRVHFGELDSAFECLFQTHMRQSHPLTVSLQSLTLTCSESTVSDIFTHTVSSLLLDPGARPADVGDGQRSTGTSPGSGRTDAGTAARTNVTRLLCA
jgi:hypothetical protein